MNFSFPSFYCHSLFYFFCWPMLMSLSWSAGAYSEKNEYDSLKCHQDLEFHASDSTEFHSDSCDNEPKYFPPPFTFHQDDLEKNVQNFVLETKEIKISEYPYAFNPSVTMWNERILMSFRIRDPHTRLTNKIGLIWLDENFNPTSAPYVLNLPMGSSLTLSKQQDPRLITIDNHLYMVYSDALPGILIPEGRRMFVTEIHFNGKEFFADPPEGLFYFENENERRWEKNWTPFDYQGHLHLIYSLKPHRILHPLGEGRCKTCASTDHPSIQWNWGILRGGTQALRDGDQYLSFFHSSISMATTHSNWVEMPHYFMGAYTFSAEPPFAITHISPNPIVGNNFYNGFPYKTWKPLRVVFPGGFIMKNNDIWVVYGRQDFELWVVKLDKKKLLQSLVPLFSQHE